MGEAETALIFTGAFFVMCALTLPRKSSWFSLLFYVTYSVLLRVLHGVGEG